MKELPEVFVFGYFSRHKYKDLVFYVENGDHSNYGLFEMPDTEENRALMEALTSQHPAPARERQPCKYCAGDYCDTCQDSTCDFYPLKEHDAAIIQGAREEFIDTLIQSLQKINNAEHQQETNTGENVEVYDDLFTFMRYRWHWFTIAIISSICMQQFVGFWWSLLMLPLVTWIVMPIVEGDL